MMVTLAFNELIDFIQKCYRKQRSTLYDMLGYFVNEGYKKFRSRNCGIDNLNSESDQQTKRMFKVKNKDVKMASMIWLG